MASEGLVASFKLLYLLIISTISNGLVGILESPSSVLVEVSICKSSNKFSAFKESPLKDIKEIRKITKGIELEVYLQNFHFI